MTQSDAKHRLCWSVLCVTLGWGLVEQACAGQACTAPNVDGVISCEAGLNFDEVAAIAAPQERPGWCWAASISMIFARHGYALPQQEIVSNAGKLLERVPSASGELISRLLSMAWTAENNSEFQSSVLAAAANGPSSSLSTETVIAELAQGRPLLLGASGHAVVLVAVQYQRSQRGTLRIRGGTVIDPAPSVGVRGLSRSEMHPSYIAAVRTRASVHASRSFAPAPM